MLAGQRREKIIEMLEIERVIPVSVFIDTFHVSFETIRRDLEALEKQGKLERMHGGAKIKEQTDSELNYLDREKKQTKEKREIANCAMNFIQEGQSIGLDVSTTNTEIAKELKNHFTQLTIITNSLQIAVELSTMPNYEIVLIGGVLRNKELCTIGEFANEFLKQFHIDVLFLSMSGISLQSGLTDYGFGEIQIKKTFLTIASTTYVVADHTKFNNSSFAKICEFKDINGIITDSSLDSEIVKQFHNKNITIIN